MSKRTATKSSKAWPTTKEELEHNRDELGLSWRAVATACGLANPGQARTAYTDLTGRPHYDSQPKVARAPRGTGPVAVKKEVVRVSRAPGWNVDTDQDDIIERLSPVVTGVNTKGEEQRSYRTVLVRRNRFGFVLEEELVVYRLEKFAFNKDETKLMVSFYDLRSGALRTVYVDDIVEVV
jgi:hypothetical protein